MRVPPRAAIALALAAALAWLPAASAHSGGAATVESRFSLPAWVGWTAAAAVVALSYVVTAAFLTRDDAAHGAPTALPAVPRARPALSVLVALLLALAGANVVTGGPLAGVVLFIGFAAALPMIAYALGDAWPAASPFRAVAPRFARAREVPSVLVGWPAAGFVLLLVALEVSGALGPRALAGVLLAYAAATLAGMAAFGGERWLDRADPVEGMLRWWAAFRASRSGAAPPARALGESAAVVALVFAVAYDGFTVTPPGRVLLRALGEGLAAHAALVLAGYALFVAAFLATARAVRRRGESRESVVAVAGRLAPALLPIAVGYHLAHNLFYLYESAPLVLGALASPLALWPVPAALATPLPIPPLLGAAFGAAQTALVVGGHVLAVVAANRTTARAFPSRVLAIRGELPLTVLMVAYTLVGLSILTGGTPA